MGRRELSRRTYEQLEIDHVAERKRLLGLRNRLEAVAEKVLDRYEERIADDGWKPCSRDVAVLAGLVEKLTVIGSGLPREHQSRSTRPTRKS